MGSSKPLPEGSVEGVTVTPCRRPPRVQLQVSQPMLVSSPRAYLSLGKLAFLSDIRQEEGKWEVIGWGVVPLLIEGG